LRRIPRRAGEHHARLRKIGPGAQRLAQQLLRLGVRAALVTKLAEVVAGVRIGGVDGERLLVAGNGAGLVAERLQRDAEIEMRLGRLRRQPGRFAVQRAGFLQLACVFGAIALGNETLGRVGRS
jgi:hypothetical protein